MSLIYFVDRLIAVIIIEFTIEREICESSCRLADHGEIFGYNYSLTL